MPELSDIDLKYAIVSLSMLIVICCFNFPVYGFFLALVKSYSCFITVCPLIIVLFGFVFGRLSCGYYAYDCFIGAIAMTNDKHIRATAEPQNNKTFFFLRVFGVVNQ